MSGRLFSRTKKDEDYTSQSMFINVEQLKNVPQVDVPSTAEQYLVSVIAERKNIPKVTQCSVDYKKFRKNQSLFYDQDPLPSVSSILKTTKEWQNIQVADFSDIRSYVSRMRNNRKEMKKVKKLDYKRSVNLFWWRHVFSKYEPTLSIVLGFRPAQVDHTLEVLIKLMKLTQPGTTIDTNIGRWVYAMLVCLKTPLHSDTFSIIRNLSKQCWELRSYINPENENAKKLAAPMSLFICLVGRYFKQLDLADSIECGID